jgi:hypothetical protein
MPYSKEKHAAHMRNWRKTHPMTEEQRKRDKCRSIAGVYLRRGRLKKEGCAVCGGAAQMHHPDYDRPLDVVWLCEKHHRDVHDWPMFLAIAREPSRGEDDKRGVNRQRAKLERVGGLDRDVGEDDRADDRDEKAQSDRQDDREDVDRR